MDNCKHIVWALDSHASAVEAFMSSLSLDYRSFRDPLVQYAGLVRYSANEVDWVLGMRRSLGLCDGCSGTCPEVGSVLAILDGMARALDEQTATCVVPVDASV